MDRITITKNDLDEAINDACEKLNLSKQNISYSIIGCTNKTITIEVWGKKQQSKLRTCPDCGKEISRKAESCPHCGCPIEKTIKCPYCDYDTDKTYKQIQELGYYIECENCGKKVEVSTPEQEVIWAKQRAMESKEVSCPYCHSINTKKISTTSKVAHTAMFGLFSISRNSKQYHCNACGADF